MNFKISDINETAIKENKCDFLYMLPFDLDENSNFTDGLIGIDEKYIWIFNSGMLSKKHTISKIDSVEIDVATGNGFMLFNINDKKEIAVRFTSSQISRYMYFKRAIEDIKRSGISRVDLFADENRCVVCNKPIHSGNTRCKDCISHKETIKRIWMIIKTRWKLYSLAFLMLFLVAGLSILAPYVTRQIIDNNIMIENSDKIGLVRNVGILFLISILTLVLSIIRGRLMAKTGILITSDLRRMIYHKLQLLSISYINKRKVGDLINRITGDTNAISRFIMYHLPNGLHVFLLIITILLVMSFMNLKMVIFMLIPIPFILIFIFFYRKIIWSRYRKQRKAFDRIYSILHDIIQGIRVVKAFGQEEKSIGQFKKENVNLKNITMDNEKLWNTMFPSIHFFFGFGLFIVMFMGGSLILKDMMKVGELIQFSAYASMIYGNLGFITFFPRMVAEVSTSSERIFNIIDTKVEIDSKSDAKKFEINGDISFNKVVFGYQTHEVVLDKVSIDIKKGEMIGLVGHSGAGKSTFINLVMRMYDVDEGEILIDGVDIRDIDRDVFSNQIGVVLQETFLFEGSVYENISYSRPDASLEDVIRAAKLANCHEFVMKFPDGYDTRVGEKGQRLSGGERQRISIARAILHNPRILILDEATSSLDTESEQKIQKALSSLIKERTTIAIAHRLSTLKNADRLVVIEKGKIAEIGTHEELMKRKGIYHSLVQSQQKIK